MFQKQAIPIILIGIDKKNGKLLLKNTSMIEEQINKGKIHWIFNRFNWGKYESPNINQKQAVNGNMFILVKWRKNKPIIINSFFVFSLI